MSRIDSNHYIDLRTLTQNISDYNKTGKDMTKTVSLPVSQISTDEITKSITDRVNDLQTDINEKKAFLIRLFQSLSQKNQ